MAKRLSSLFSLSREDKSRPEISPSAKPPAAPLSQSITQTNTSLPNKLHKNYVDNSSRLESNVLFPQLDPPPLLSESGLFIPPSSQRSGPDSGLSSRASSPYSFTPVQSRDGSRSRPQTPIPSVPLGAANAPGQPATPTSAKVKKRSWIPGKHDRHEVTDEKHQKAWIAGLEKCVGYDLTPLVEGERVTIIAPKEYSMLNDIRYLTFGMIREILMSTSTHSLQDEAHVSRSTLCSWPTPRFSSICVVSPLHSPSMEPLRWTE